MTKPEKRPRFRSIQGAARRPHQLPADACETPGIFRDQKLNRQRTTNVRSRGMSLV